MRLWPASEVYQENLLLFDSLDWRQVSGIYVWLSPSIGVSRASFGQLQTFSQILLGWAIIVFKGLYRMSPHERLEVVDFVTFNQLILKF